MEGGQRLEFRWLGDKVPKDSLNSTVDVRSWRWDPNGVFLVESCYKGLQQSSGATKYTVPSLLVVCGLCRQVPRGVHHCVELKRRGKIQMLLLSCDNLFVVDLVNGVKQPTEVNGQDFIDLVLKIREDLNKHFGPDWEVEQNDREGLFLVDYLSYLGWLLENDDEFCKENYFDFTSRYSYYRDVDGPPYEKLAKIPKEQLSPRTHDRMHDKRELKWTELSPDEREARKQAKIQKYKRKKQNRKARKAQLLDAEED
ncbi:hypothetical protein MKW98_004821 [Papaver atlanticum]|uniref:Uncharacterized protein n=1 Tax=Papaver atlanticum TaxID=357466 RepID=A0AAD4SHD3_9MAGN|nr:hypothetical protein MKW98_004821 [Papaver atlanticum]